MPRTVREEPSDPDEPCLRSVCWRATSEYGLAFPSRFVRNGVGDGHMHVCSSDIPAVWSTSERERTFRLHPMGSGRKEGERTGTIDPIDFPGVWEEVSLLRDFLKRSLAGLGFLLH